MITNKIGIKSVYTFQHQNIAHTTDKQPDRHTDSPDSILKYTL